MKINLIIPAKGTSQRIKNKNLCTINGKSLVRLACEKALRCSNVNEVYLDTESEEIISSVADLEKSGLKIIKRAKELANNDIGANEMMVYGLHSVSDCDVLLQTFSTSPLITSKTIDFCIDKFLSASESHDSFFTVVPVQEYFWNEEEAINFNPDKVPNSFELDKMYMETHGLYGIKTSTLIEKQTRVGYSPLKIEIPKIESFDVNVIEDLKIIERLMSNVSK